MVSESDLSLLYLPMLSPHIMLFMLQISNPGEGDVSPLLKEWVVVSLNGVRQSWSWASFWCWIWSTFHFSLQWVFGLSYICTVPVLFPAPTFLPLPSCSLVVIYNSFFPCLQCALLYTTIDGQRRIRISTFSLPCTTMLSDLFRSADLDTQFACILKQGGDTIS